MSRDDAAEASNYPDTWGTRRRLHRSGCAHSQDAGRRAAHSHRDRQPRGRSCELELQQAVSTPSRAPRLLVPLRPTTTAWWTLGCHLGLELTLRRYLSSASAEHRQVRVVREKATLGIAFSWPGGKPHRLRQLASTIVSAGSPHRPVRVRGAADTSPGARGSAAESVAFSALDEKWRVRQQEASERRARSRSDELGPGLRIHGKSELLKFERRDRLTRRELGEDEKDPSGRGRRVTSGREVDPVLDPDAVEPRVAVLDARPNPSHAHLHLEAGEGRQVLDVSHAVPVGVDGRVTQAALRRNRSETARILIELRRAELVGADVGCSEPGPQVAALIVRHVRREKVIRRHVGSTVPSRTGERNGVRRGLAPKAGERREKGIDRRIVRAGLAPDGVVRGQRTRTAEQEPRISDSWPDFARSVILTLGSLTTEPSRDQTTLGLAFSARRVEMSPTQRPLDSIGRARTP
jgi:hypothetical protein